MNECIGGIDVSFCCSFEVFVFFICRMAVILAIEMKFLPRD